MCSFLVSPRRTARTIIAPTHCNPPTLGYSNTLEGLSGGFVYGAGGSGLITPRFGMSPLGSPGTGTPSHCAGKILSGELTQHKIDAAFDLSRTDGISLGS